MDSALHLKQLFDSGETIDSEYAIELLNKSDVVKALLADYEFDALNLLTRLLGLAEIPYINKISKVAEWAHQLADMSFCGDGFSYSGKSNEILSCYNSMITTALLRLKHNDIDKIEKGIEWILKYQNFDRNLDNKWTGKALLKYGGCMKNTPCFIGVVKATQALSTYKKMLASNANINVDAKLNKGLQYILRHEVYKRESNQMPITKDITKLVYPYSYKTNLIEILVLLKENYLNNDERCSAAKSFLKLKQKKDGYWYVNSSYKPKCWVNFDETKQPGLWITHEIKKGSSD